MSIASFVALGAAGIQPFKDMFFSGGTTYPKRTRKKCIDCPYFEQDGDWGLCRKDDTRKPANAWASCK